MTTGRSPDRMLGDASFDPDSDTLRRALALINVIRDPALPGILVSLGLLVAAFIMVGFSWAGVAGTLLVPLQIPYVVSGGLGGMSLLVVGVMLASIHIDRRDGVEANDEIAQVARDIAGVVDAAKGCPEPNDRREP